MIITVFMFFSGENLNQQAQLPGEYLWHQSGEGPCDDPQPCHLYSFICPNGRFPKSWGYPNHPVVMDDHFSIEHIEPMMT